MPAFILSLSSASASVAEDYRYPLLTVPYAVEPPTIDGVVDEQEWQGATSINGFKTRATRFWVTWDEDHIYVAMRSPLREGERVIQELRDTDKPINVVFDDSYEIWLDLDTRSPDGQDVHFQYLANFAGARYDIMHEPDVGNMRGGWTAGWGPVNRITPDGRAWEMEVAIPRQSMYRETPLREGETILCLLARNFKRPWEQAGIAHGGIFSVRDTHARLVLAKSAPAVHVLGVSDPQSRAFGLDLGAFTRERPVDLVWHFESDAGISHRGTFTVPAGDFVLAPGTARSWDVVEKPPRGTGSFRIRVTSADGETTYLDYASTRDFDRRIEQALALPEPDSDERIGVTLSLNPVDDYVRVIGDFIDFRQWKDVKHCQVGVRDGDGNVLASDTFTLDDKQYARGLIRLPELSTGIYKVSMQVIAHDGTTLRTVEEAVEKHDHAEAFPWWETEVGNLEAVVPPWTPMRAHGLDIHVWGRTMRVGAAGLPECIVSQENALLAAPATLVAELLDGRIVAAVDGGSETLSVSDHRVETLSRATLDDLEIETRVRAEFDGMYKVELTMTPREAVKVRALQVVLPLVGTKAEYVIGIGEGIRSGYEMKFLPAGEEGRIWDSTQVDFQPMTVGSFVPYVWVGNPESGLAWFADSDQGWVPGDTKPAIELVRHGQRVDFVMNLIADEFVIDEPRTVVFALQASPARPLVGEWRTERWWCGDTFSHSWGCWVYPDGKGNTIWASRPTTTNAELARERIAEYRTRGGLVVPYFEYNTMADDGEQAYFGESWKANTGQEPLWYGRSLADYILWNLDQWIKSCGIDGWYLDNVRPVHCDNIDAGRGYRLPDGRIQPEYNMFIMREFFLRLRAIWYENGREPTIVNHMTNCMILPWNAPVDVAYDGEHHVIYPQMGKDFMDFWSLERLRMIVPGTWGVNVNFMSAYHGRWSPEDRTRVLRAYMGAVILHDALPTGNDRWRPEIRALLEVREAFGIADESVRFIGYWVEDSGLKCATDDVYLAGWHKPGSLMVAVVNWGEAATADVHIDLDRLGMPAGSTVFDAENPEVALTMEQQRVQVPLDRHNFRLIVVQAP